MASHHPHRTTRRLLPGALCATLALTIAASALGDDQMLLRVTNSGGSGKPKPRGRRDSDRIEGTGVGLANVCQRLEARFGGQATCDYGPLDDGGFEVVAHAR